MREDAFDGRWVLWRETHEWWRLPEHGGPYAYTKKRPVPSIPFPEAIPNRERRFISQDQMHDVFDIAKEKGWQEPLHFPGDIVAIVRTVHGFEMELIWWDV